LLKHMKAAEGIITLAQEGRFALVTDGGRVMQFVLAHDARFEPQDLPRLQKTQCRVRVGYTKPTRIVSRKRVGRNLCVPLPRGERKGTAAREGEGCEVWSRPIGF
jgi:hypothetical protein